MNTYPIEINPDLLNEIEVMAKAATPGPRSYTDQPQLSRMRKLHWVYSELWGLLGNFDHGEHTSRITEDGSREPFYASAEGDARLAARMDPDTVLALVAALRESCTNDMACSAMDI